MNKKLTGKALVKFEAKRDVWQEVLDGVREIKAGGGRRTTVEAKSQVGGARLKSGLSKAKFAAALGLSKRTSAQAEQGRCKPSRTAKQLSSSVTHRDSSTEPDNPYVSLRLHDY
ncbi:MAG: hypothetical protein MRJ68_21640 [Nitrospira sp.]|nr:hypothetical protein [Nitrospira sp.]